MYCLCCRIDPDLMNISFICFGSCSFIAHQFSIFAFSFSVPSINMFACFIYQVIEKPMDFSTIKNKMDGKDGTGYKNVREIYADVRLVFKNAMKYNDERDDVHVMAKSLLEKFEEKWLQLLPKVVEEVS